MGRAKTSPIRWGRWAGRCGCEEEIPEAGDSTPRRHRLWGGHRGGVGGGLRAGEAVESAPPEIHRRDGVGGGLRAGEAVETAVRQITRQGPAWRAGTEGGCMSQR